MRLSFTVAAADKDYCWQLPPVPTSLSDIWTAV